MGAERDAMANRGVGTAADEILGQAGNPGGTEQGGASGAGGSSAAGGEAPGAMGQAGGASGAGNGSSDGTGGSADVGGDGAREEQRPQVEGCNDQDKVARQLCEAATEEQDPFLRAALWDEYNEYKRILARQ